MSLRAEMVSLHFRDDRKNGFCAGYAVMLHTPFSVFLTRPLFGWFYFFIDIKWKIEIIIRKAAMFSN